MKKKFNETNIGSFHRDLIKPGEVWVCDYCGKEMSSGFYLTHNENKRDYCSIKCAVDEANEKEEIK